jgi:hypothetical protein
MVQHLQVKAEAAEAAEVRKDKRVFLFISVLYELRIRRTGSFRGNWILTALTPNFFLR